MDLIGVSWKEVTMPVPWERPPREHIQNRICVVDDDEWVVDSLKLLLETFGFDVLSYTSSGEFFADGRHRTAGCLVIDQHMPDIAGLDVVDRLQKEGVRVPMILLTGQLDKNTRQRAANLGIASVVEKPFAADRLLELIRRALLERN